jgi:hypothetical protein
MKIDREHHLAFDIDVNQLIVTATPIRIGRQRIAAG